MWLPSSCVCVYVCMYVRLTLDRIDNISLDCSLLQACENIDHLIGVCACIFCMLLFKEREREGEAMGYYDAPSNAPKLLRVF